MKRKRFTDRGAQTALMCVMLLAVAAGGIKNAGHGSASEESAENTGRKRAAEKNAYMAEVSEMDFHNVSERAALTQDEPEVGIQGNILTYGGLIVALPEGIEAKLIEARDNGNIFCTGNFLSDGSKGRILDLCGAQEVYADRVGGDGIEVYLALPPRVRLMHYTAVYDSETALLCTLFDLLPEAVGRRMYADEGKGEYAYRLEQDGYLYLFLVRGEEVCLVQEIAEEKDCSFGELLADGAVSWKESGANVGFWQKPDAFSYRRIVPEEGVSLLYACERQEDGANLRLYREGCYEKPWQEILGDLGSNNEDWTQVRDINSDGCPDMLGYKEIYLWNRQTKSYEQAQSGIAWPYKQDKEMCGTKEERKYIPQGLSDEIGGLMAAGADPVILSEVGDEKESAVLSAADGKYADCLSSTAGGRELTQEEAVALAGKDMAVRQQVQEAAHYCYLYTLMEADCDNDGRADLVGQLYGHFIGGTSGNADYIFLQGQPDGFYEETDDFFVVQGKFGVIAYEGKNYLCRLDFDYGSMFYEGYTVSCHEDGKRVEEVSIRMVPERYEVRQISSEAGYEDLARRMMKECVSVKEQLDGGQMIQGKAERVLEQLPEQTADFARDSYRCDLDNDGQEERYSKEIRHLANFYGKDYLEFTVEGDDTAGQDGEDVQNMRRGENRGLTMLKEEITGGMDSPRALWVEEYEGKNIVHVLYLTGLGDCRITGYLVEETGYGEVYGINLDAVYKVEQERRVAF